ncbi:hypothetical protein M501DRAFT_930391 [Patellaria atrata CBS 101060]|uniref:CCZ1/INTU/HSP4 first Longin domain-containing protein n=1 Tax=Patellaria atrata CBS 101060 TaxID=1346257 RepID=A0A9P4VTE3_9PEZI|nr:hypothetical protein M501DRAFT_930391 [Patellaria atrata CBS 101060]
MSSSEEKLAKVIPAQLSSLVIYNPSLGPTDETFQDQLVYYYTKDGESKKKTGDDDKQEQKDKINEILRQIGLAQGMLNFARSFSNGQDVDSVDTEKSRVVIHELEKGWWILACISLTQLPATSPSTPASGSSRRQVEYSSREVAPTPLLLQHLLRAHRIFLLHHGSSLSDLFGRQVRTKFCNLLEKFWNRFARSWDVLLHGSPAVDIYGATKLATSGELGIGVGEEEWGSGEREVLEDFTARTEGLVDLVVSRFGQPSAEQLKLPKNILGTTLPSDIYEGVDPWMCNGECPGAHDGVIFSGNGALSRSSLKDISSWLEWIYMYGENAYGVRENPTSNRKKRRQRNIKRTESKTKGPQHGRRVSSNAVPIGKISSAASTPGIPPPIVSAAQRSLEQATSAADNDQSAPSSNPFAAIGDAETWKKVITLGYGSAWGGKRPPPFRQPTYQSMIETPGTEEPIMQYLEPEPDVNPVEQRLRIQVIEENVGHFIIGLKGDLEDDEDDKDEERHENMEENSGWNSRTLLRTLHVELMDKTSEEPTADIDSSATQIPSTMSTPLERTRLRVVIYVHRPFIYAFLFNPRTESLSIPSFYRQLHTYLSPLHRPLSTSTSPERVAARIAAASRPYTTLPSQSTEEIQPIFDLVFDPVAMSIHSSIPNIPEPGTVGAEGLSGGDTAGTPGWTRVEALNVHSQILATVASTRAANAKGEIERTAKTSRGWWIVWMRLPPKNPRLSIGSDTETETPRQYSPSDLREAFLVRRSRESVGGKARARTGSAMWRLGGAGADKTGGAAAGWGPSKLAEGIGVDARKYVEGLLSLNR